MAASGHLNFFLGIVGIFAILPSSTSILLELLRRTQNQSHFSTVLLLSDNPGISVQQELMSALGIPLIQLTSSASYRLKHQFRDDIVSLVYVTPDNFQKLIEVLAADLHRIAQTKIIFVCSGMRNMMEHLFKICWKKKMINAIALVGTTYFSFNPFPKLHIQEHLLDEQREIFPNRLSNVNKHPLRVIIDGVEPRDYIYINREGKRTLGGYTAHLLSAFADKINAALTTPIDSGTSILYHQDIDELLATDVADVFGGLVILMPSKRGQSDIAETVKLCLMLPVEAKIPHYLYYPVILKSYPVLMILPMIAVLSLLIWVTLRVDAGIRLQLIYLVFNEKCFRAVLGQSFTEYPRSSMKLRSIYFLSSALGLLFSVIYLATLNTIMTSPPTEPLVTTFEDIRRSHYKVILYRLEYNEVLSMTSDFEQYNDIFEFTHNHTYFHHKRNSLDTRFAYSVPTNKWKIFQEQQSYFTAPLFRFSNLCLIPVMSMVFLLNENSVYLEVLNRMLVQTHQSGLYDYWVKKSFLELVEAKRIRLDMGRRRDENGPLALRDIIWLVGLFGVMMLINCGIFVAEVIWHKTERRRIVFSRRVLGRFVAWRG